MALLVCIIELQSRFKLTLLSLVSITHTFTFSRENSYRCVLRRPSMSKMTYSMFDFDGITCETMLLSWWYYICRWEIRSIGFPCQIYLQSSQAECERAVRSENMKNNSTYYCITGTVICRLKPPKLNFRRNSARQPSASRRRDQVAHQKPELITEFIPAGKFFSC